MVVAVDCLGIYCNLMEMKVDSWMGIEEQVGSWRKIEVLVGSIK